MPRLDPAAALRGSPAAAPAAFHQSAGAIGYSASPPEEDEGELIRRHVPTVKRLAAHLKGRLPETISIEDLVQAGLIAVLRLLRKRAEDHLNPAVLRRTIINAMIDEARSETWAPVRTVRLAKAAAEAMRTVKKLTGRDGSDEEIAAAMQISLSEYHRILVEIAGIKLLRLDLFEESAEDRLQIQGDQETGLHKRRVLAALAEAVASLPEREKLVVSLYYEHELSMEEVGSVLGLDKSTVCRAHGRALLILRSAMGSDGAVWVTGE